MLDLRELLGDDDYEATIDKAVETAERYFTTANYTHPDEGVTRCDYGCGVQLIERTIEHVTARILEAVLPDLLACMHCGGDGFEPTGGRFKDSHACSVCGGEGDIRSHAKMLRQENDGLRTKLTGELTEDEPDRVADVLAAHEHRITWDWYPFCTCGWRADQTHDVASYGRHVARAALRAARGQS